MYKGQPVIITDNVWLMSCKEKVNKSVIECDYVGVNNCH